MDSEITNEIKYRITKGKGRASYQGWYLDGKTWKNLRPAETTFESVQMAIFDDMTKWAFPDHRLSRIPK